MRTNKRFKGTGDYRARIAITWDRSITERGYILWSKRVERTDIGHKMGSSALYMYIGWIKSTHVGWIYAEENQHRNAGRECIQTEYVSMYGIVIIENDYNGAEGFTQETITH